MTPWNINTKGCVTPALCQSHWIVKCSSRSPYQRILEEYAKVNNYIRLDTHCYHRETCFNVNSWWRNNFLFVHGFPVEVILFGHKTNRQKFKLLYMSHPARSRCDKKGSSHSYCIDNPQRLQCKKSWGLKENITFSPLPIFQSFPMWPGIFLPFHTPCLVYKANKNYWDDTLLSIQHCLG